MDTGSDAQLGSSSDNSVTNCDVCTMPIEDVKLKFKCSTCEEKTPSDEQSWSSGLGTSLLTRGSCVRIPLRSRLEGSQCHPPPQGGTGCGKMDDISPSPTVGPALSRPGANKKKKRPLIRK